MVEIEEAAKSFHKAMKGIGTDESRIIKEIIKHSNGNRQQIKAKYLTMFGKTLEDDLKSEIGGNFLDGVLALLTPSLEYEAKCVRDAMKGLGTNELVLTQIVCPMEAHEIEILKATYKRMYDRDLEHDIASEDSSDFGRILRAIASGGRPQNRGYDEALAKKEAQELYDAGVGKFGTNETTFIQVLCSRSFQQLSATFSFYQKIASSDIEKSIQKEMSGNLEKACLAIVKSVKNRPAYYAEQLHEAMKGLGTKDNDLIRLLVLRSEIDLPAIKQQYKLLYGKSLYDAVKSELSGDYEKLFLALIGKD